MTDDKLLTECAMTVKPELWGGQPRKSYRRTAVLYVDYMNRRKQLINEPDDADATDTPAKYVTQDANGEWWWYDTKPYIASTEPSFHGWDSDGWQTLATRGKVPAGHDWRTTLREVKPMTTTPNAPAWPRHPAHKPQLNPKSSSLTDSQARVMAAEVGACSDGEPCRPNYCDDCPNAPEDESEWVLLDRRLNGRQDVDAHYQHYYKGIMLDPYRIAAVYNMQGGPREHIMKKCLRFTDKGQSEQQVINEIRKSLNRWQAMLDEDAAS